MKKNATTEVPINDVIAQRWSPRAFDSNHVITEDVIKSLFEAARWAPSCYGDQPWQFVLFQKKDATAWSRALNCLSVGNQNWAMDASILMWSVLIKILIIIMNQIAGHIMIQVRLQKIFAYRLQVLVYQLTKWVVLIKLK